MFVNANGIVYSIDKEVSGTRSNGTTWNMFILLIETHRTSEKVFLIHVPVFNKKKDDFPIGAKISFQMELITISKDGNYFYQGNMISYLIDSGSKSAALADPRNPPAEEPKYEGKKRGRKKKSEYTEENLNSGKYGDIPF